MLVVRELAAALASREFAAGEPVGVVERGALVAFEAVLRIAGENAVVVVEELCGIVEGIGQAGIVDGLVLVLAVGPVVAECCCSRMLHLDRQTASRLVPRVRSSK